MNIDIEKMSEACENLQTAVEALYQVCGGEDVLDLGFGFAETTAQTVREYISNYEKKVAWLDSPAPVTGYLLEIFCDGEWHSYEFDPMENSNIWGNEYLYKKFSDEDVGIGFYEELEEHTWLNSSCDWKYRIGADFDARVTPTERPSPIDTWGGELKSDCGNNLGELWRVRKVTISGRLSEKAKKFFTDHPNATWETK